MQLKVKREIIQVELKWNLNENIYWDDLYILDKHHIALALVIFAPKKYYLK